MDSLRRNTQFIAGVLAGSFLFSLLHSAPAAPPPPSARIDVGDYRTSAGSIPPLAAPAAAALAPLLPADPSGPASAPRCRPGVYKGRHPPCPVQLHVLTPSCAQSNNAERRRTIRYNLQRSFDAARYSLAYYFLVTFSGDPGAWEAILAENATHGDIFVAPFDRTQPPGSPPQLIREKDMVKKVWHEMAFAAEAGAARGWQPRFWAKLDDDVTVLWDRFMPALEKEMPDRGLVWCSQGTGAWAERGGYKGLYCNGPYLLSIDVVNKVASDVGQASVAGLYAEDASKVWEYNDDYVIIRRNYDNGNIQVPGFDQRWHGDDVGSFELCACKPWTLTSDSLVVHHAPAALVRAWHENRTLFALMGQPFRPYGYNLCPEDRKGDPTCNYLPGCNSAAAPGGTCAPGSAPGPAPLPRGPGGAPAALPQV